MTVLEKKGYLNNIQAYKQYMLATNSADAASSIYEVGEAEVLGCRVPPYVILDQFAFHVPHRMSFLIKAYRSPHHLSLQISNCSSRLRCAREGSKGSSLYDVNGLDQLALMDLHSQTCFATCVDQITSPSTW